MLKKRTRIDDNVGGMTTTTKHSISSQFDGASPVSSGGVGAGGRDETTNGNNISHQGAGKEAESTSSAPAHSFVSLDKRICFHVKLDVEPAPIYERINSVKTPDVRTFQAINTVNDQLLNSMSTFCTILWEHASSFFIHNQENFTQIYQTLHSLNSYKSQKVNIEVCISYQSIKPQYNPYESHISPYDTMPFVEMTKNEKLTGLLLEKWKEKLLNCEKCILNELQNGFNIPLLTTSDQFDHRDLPENCIIYHNEDKHFLNGEAEIFYTNGDYFWGSICDGVKSGAASIVKMNGDMIDGHFVDDKLEGLVVENVTVGDYEGVKREVFYCQGVRHGFYREIKHGVFWTLGRYINGVKAGLNWCREAGDCFLVGSIDDDNKMNGSGCLYLYPDLKTAMEVQFNHGKMVVGHIVEINQIR